jgi:hypothetical protein
MSQLIQQLYINIRLEGYHCILWLLEQKVASLLLSSQKKTLASPTPSPPLKCLCLAVKWLGWLDLVTVFDYHHQTV